VPLLQFEQRQRDKRAFPKTSRRQQKHLLPIRQIPDQLLQFGGPIDEIRLLDDLAENKRIFLIRHYANQRNAFLRNHATPIRINA
jgi:hypothetical protein